MCNTIRYDYAYDRLSLLGVTHFLAGVTVVYDELIFKCREKSFLQ